MIKDLIMLDLQLIFLDKIINIKLNALYAKGKISTYLEYLNRSQRYACIITKFGSALFKFQIYEDKETHKNELFEKLE